VIYGRSQPRSCGSIMYIYITCEHTASKQDVAARNCKLEIIVHGTYNIIYTVCRYYVNLICDGWALTLIRAHTYVDVVCMIGVRR
jgi:hypothetical protein